MGGAPLRQQWVRAVFRSLSGPGGGAGEGGGVAVAVGSGIEGALAASPPGYATVGRVLLRMRVLRALAWSQALVHMCSAWAASLEGAAVGVSHWDCGHSSGVH